MNRPYKNISDTNTAFGNRFGSCLDKGVINNYDKLYNQGMNLYDEHQELHDDGFSILKDNPLSKEGRIGMVDAIADILVFLYGIPHFLGYHYEEQKSNETLKEILTNYETDGDKSFYEHVLEDTNQLIDEIMEPIKNKKNHSIIISKIKELDIYLHTLCDLYQIDVKNLIEKVTLSNMSKLCKNDKEVEDTMYFYTSKGVEVYSGKSPLLQEDGTPFYVVYSSKDQTVNDKVYRADKFLKCINWFEPDLSDI